MRLVGIASIGLFVAAVAVALVLDEVDGWFERGRRLARTHHME